MFRFTFKLLVFAIMIFSSFAFVQAQSKQKGKQLEVNIFFMKVGEGFGSEASEENPFGLIAVKRKVNAESPLQDALIALTKEPTKKEKARNLHSAVWGINFVSVKVEDGTAHALFSMPLEANFSGDNAPDIFKSAVEQTALQFPSVKKVEVCLDGIIDFEIDDPDFPTRRCDYLMDSCESSVLRFLYTDAKNNEI